VAVRFAERVLRSGRQAVSRRSLAHVRSIGCVCVCVCVRPLFLVITINAATNNIVSGFLSSTVFSAATTTVGPTAVSLVGSNNAYIQATSTVIGSLGAVRTFALWVWMCAFAHLPIPSPPLLLLLQTSISSASGRDITLSGATTAVASTQSSLTFSGQSALAHVVQGIVISGTSYTSTSLTASFISSGANSFTCTYLSEGSRPLLFQRARKMTQSSQLPF